ncbi:serine/threonine protein kinase, partial [Sulfuricaulis sp.]|uniref:serine/threonine protein kinase n=1 Tax=Sulfuricaulis sp. TaxID=2003553 RepID=UPI00355A1B39
SQGKAVDQRTDLYALGLILYECLTGRRAFAGATPVEVALKQIKERPVPPRQLLSATPPHLEAIVMRCLEKEPSRRFASAAELQRALTPPSESSRRSAPRWQKLAAISVVALLAVVVVHKTVKQASSSPQPAAPFQTESASTDFQDQRQVPEELVKLFQAAKQGDAAAQERVGRLYLDGPERARDERKAFFWTRRAALSGDHNAQLTIARMYESGRGVTQNRIGAYVWYSVAAASGSEPARESLGRLKGDLSGDEITAAEQRLRLLRGGQEN